MEGNVRQEARHFRSLHFWKNYESRVVGFVGSLLFPFHAFDFIVFAVLRILVCSKLCTNLQSILKSDSYLEYYTRTNLQLWNVKIIAAKQQVTTIQLEFRGRRGVVIVATVVIGRQEKVSPITQMICVETSCTQICWRKSADLKFLPWSLSSNKSHCGMWLKACHSFLTRFWRAGLTFLSLSLSLSRCGESPGRFDATQGMLRRVTPHCDSRLKGVFLRR